MIPTITTTTVVVGTGSAGYCAADRLLMAGHRDLIMITDKIRAGSSRNAGSDKQTYYKISLAGTGSDSVDEFAETLFSGGAMDGDNALAEAAVSTRAFLHLVDAGVPFPTDRYGQFPGYKTDHDPRERATSVGPYTSKQMTERLEDRVKAAGVQILEGCRVIDLIVRDGKILGLLVMNKSDDATHPLLLIRAANVVYATGGPAGIYADSVFPHGQWGATGAAIRAGAPVKNATEWQFGLASTNPRWNVSGSYMQVMPRFVSTDQDGNDEREFLTENIPDYATLMTMVFLKGYQWPFDARKATDGSSQIDLLVYRETVQRRRRVYLDFTRNPMDRDFDITAVSDEAREYLERTGVDQIDPAAPPVERLKKLNLAAYNFYLERGPVVDLASDWLEVAVCAQHNNGGLEVDAWWRSPIDGLYPVGEAAGSHGVYRPGGAALNSGQVGATRAAQWISQRGHTEPPSEQDFVAAAEPVVAHATALMAAAGERHEAGAEDNVGQMLTDAARSMSDHAGLVRSADSVSAARDIAEAALASYDDTVTIDTSSRRSVDRLFLVRDILTTQYVYLEAMLDYLNHGGNSRGSVVYTDPAGELPRYLADETYRFISDDGALDGEAQIVSADWSLSGVPNVHCRWRPVRPIPKPDEPFEVVWAQYLDDKNVH